MQEFYIYIASPYSSSNEEILEERAEAVAYFAKDLIEKVQQPIYSPVSTGHGISKLTGIGGTWDIWKKQCLPFVKGCDLMVVLQLDGWETSVGVQCEICLAEELGKTVLLIPADYSDKDIDNISFFYI